MTQNIPPIGKAMTAVAAIIAFAAAPSFAQETAPPESVVDTSGTPATPDPLAPDAADVGTDTNVAPPPAPKPKVETSRVRTASATTASRSKPGASASAIRPTIRRTSKAAPPAAPVAAAAATVAAPAAEAAPPPAASPPASVEPAAPPATEPAPASNLPDALMADLLANDMVPAGAAALGLLALGGTGMAMRRRKRRRQDAEFEARQQALAGIDEEPPVLDLDRQAEVRPGPAFARPAAPIHDPVPARAAQADGWESRPQADFILRRAGPSAKNPVEQG